MPDVEQLLPDPAEPAHRGADLDQAQLVSAYLADERTAPPGRPWVALSMVTSVDGATSADGRSGGLSSPADKARAVHSQQVHGGVYGLPFVLENAIRMAALIGMGRKPSLLLARGGSKSQEQRSAT